MNRIVISIVMASLTALAIDSLREARKFEKKFENERLKNRMSNDELLFAFGLLTYDEQKMVRDRFDTDEKFFEQVAHRI